MKRSILFLILLASLFSGCGSSSSTNTNIQNPHAGPHQDMHNELIAEEVKKSEQEIEIPVSQTDIQRAKSDHPKADFYNEKWKNGIIFYAVGNEPSWSLSIDKKNTVSFKSLDGIVFSASSVSKLASIDANTRGYRILKGKEEVLINIVEEKCMDTMADEEFSFSVSVDLKLKDEKSFTTFKGCGDYIPDPRLHGKWIIVKADTIAITKDEFPRKQPELTIDVYEGKVSGNDGCNLLNGGVKIRENQIIFGMMASTMMACPDMEFSSVITRSFVNKKLSYKFKNQLSFYEGEKEVMILNRVDN